ncbi:MAG TPA: MOSC domain-containing protein [Candidatus Dormibacteraeota bacterium]|nr:MOSC domain-containing protein [Candidatus Dormibacteraeota bacterium]
MDGSNPETCAECGFDSAAWRVRDAGTLFGALGYWWRLATAGVEAADLNRRPVPEVWSALEYGLHTAMVTAMIRAGVELVLDCPGTVLPEPPPMPGAHDADPLELEPGEVLGLLEAEGADMARVTGRRHAPWQASGTLPDGTVIQAEAVLFHAAHDVSHHFLDLSRGLSTLGLGTPPGRGSVVQVSVSAGGVPKLPVPEAAIGPNGLAGDRQADRKHHGRPFQAVCLWSQEAVDRLSAAGHPLTAGRAGENVTVAGLDWASLRPGSRVAVGSALLELSYPATPCHKQARWFSDGDFTRIDHGINPQWARWYGWVRRPGTVRPGDQVVLQPAE